MGRDEERWGRHQEMKAALGHPDALDRALSDAWQEDPPAQAGFDYEAWHDSHFDYTDESQGSLFQVGSRHNDPVMAPDLPGDLRIITATDLEALYNENSALKLELAAERARTSEFVDMLREVAPGAFATGVSEIDAARRVVKTVRDAMVAMMPPLAQSWKTIRNALQAAGLKFPE